MYTSSRNTKIIATQIDLARRKETAEEIRAFLTHAGKCGYNTVLFYLEDRIRTVSYPYPTPDESYTPDEMRELVTFAATLGIEIIPVVSNHSHTERFLRHGELLPMAELYGNIKGRFSEAGSAYYGTTCTERECTRQFFDNYYRELSEIFPSEYFHVGLDEAFDIASCPHCRERFLREGGFSGIWLDNVRHIHSLLSSLGKRMMLFDDMLYFMPELIPELPKDIVLCSWNYEYIDRTPGAQFGNSRRLDLFSLYDSAGLAYMPAIWATFDYNIDTMTAYANRHSPVGYLATTWQMDTAPLISNYVGIAYAGLLWNGKLVEDPHARRKLALRASLDAELSEPECSLLALAATKLYANRAPRHFHFASGTIVRRNVNFDEEHKLNLTLRDSLSDVPKTPLTDYLLDRLDSAILHYRKLITTQRLFDLRSGVELCDKAELISELSALRKETESEIESWGRIWDNYRRDIPKDYSGSAEIMLADIDRLIGEAKEAKAGDRGAFDFVILLPDKTTRSLIAVDITYSDGVTERIGEGIFKPYATSCYNITEKGPYVYTVTILTRAVRVASVRFTVHGNGSTCLCHASHILNGKAASPVSVGNAVGKVIGAERMLKPDTLFAELGEGDMFAGFYNTDLPDTEHSVTLNYKAVTPS